MDSVNHQQIKGNKWGAWLSSVTVIIYTGKAKDARRELTQSTSKSVNQIAEAGPDCVNMPVLGVFLHTDLE